MVKPEKIIKKLVSEKLPHWKVKFDLAQGVGFCERKPQILHFHKGYVKVLPKTELIWVTKHEIAHAKTSRREDDVNYIAHSQEFFENLKKLGMRKESEERLTCRLPTFTERAGKIRRPKKLFWG